MIRKLVTLTPELAAAVDRFRRSDEMRRKSLSGLPSESETIRHLMVIALDARAIREAQEG